MSQVFDKNLFVGFVFSDNLKDVLLQKSGNTLDGVLIDPGSYKKTNEDVILSQTIKEMFNIAIEPGNWSIVTTIQHIDRCYIINVHRAIVSFSDLKIKDGCEIHQVDNLPGSCIPSLHWLIPLCLDVSVLGSAVNQILTR